MECSIIRAVLPKGSGARYERETFVSEDKAYKLSWKARSFRGFIVRNTRGEKVAVLIMESKKPQGLSAITDAIMQDEATYLQFLVG
jgi:hypothetical protein